MLLLSLKREQTEESAEESEQFFQAEVFIHKLSQEEQDLIEIYINHFIGTGRAIPVSAWISGWD